LKKPLVDQRFVYAVPVFLREFLRLALDSRSAWLPWAKDNSTSINLYLRHFQKATLGHQVSD